MHFTLFLLIQTIIIAADLQNKTFDFCNNLTCDDTRDVACGMRAEDAGFRLKLFRNECQLLKHGCDHDEEAYGLINKEFCESENQEQKLAEILLEDDCGCKENSTRPVCAIRNYGEAFEVKWFDNRCKLIDYNCRNDVKYIETDDFVCSSTTDEQNDTRRVGIDSPTIDEVKNITNLLVVHTRRVENEDVNNTIDNFFAATHVIDVPLERADYRRRWIKNAGPKNVFVPLKTIPKNLSDDYEHKPLLKTCLHKCPKSCPAVYAPVCGQTDYDTRTPSLMFQNHCYMDMATCKMYWETGGEGGTYWESTIVFCMGDEMDGAYRFVPALRTLQKMGRLKRKGDFRHSIRNFRYLTDVHEGLIKPMG